MKNKIITLAILIIVTSGCMQDTSNKIVSDNPIIKPKLKLEELLSNYDSINRDFSLDSLIGFRGIFLGDRINRYDYSNWSIKLFNGYSNQLLILSKQFNDQNFSNIGIYVLDGLISKIEVNLNDEKNYKELEVILGKPNDIEEISNESGAHKILAPVLYDDTYNPAYNDGTNFPKRKGTGLVFPKQVIKVSGLILEWEGLQSKIYYKEFERKSLMPDNIYAPLSERGEKWEVYNTSILIYTNINLENMTDKNIYSYTKFINNRKDSLYKEKIRKNF